MLAAVLEAREVASNWSNESAALKASQILAAILSPRFAVYLCRYRSGAKC